MLLSSPTLADRQSSQPARHHRLWLGSILIAATAILFLTFASDSNVIAATSGWEFQPYRVHAIVVVDAPGGLADRWNTEIPAYLQHRVDAALAPTWKFDVELAAGAQRAAVIEDLSSQSGSTPSYLPNERDKLLLLAVKATPLGFELSAREFDAYLQHWGPTLHRVCRQPASVSEQLFELAQRAFTPLARFEVDPTDPQTVTLQPRGSALAPSADAAPWAKPGDVFVPYLRRTGRNGELAENGVSPVPWTYIEATEGADKSIKFHVTSGSRRPFGARRQARVEQLALAAQPAESPTILTLRARKDEKKPLIGYEVLAQTDPQTPPVSIGFSDAAGQVRILPGKDPVEMLQIKHGNQLIARLPVAPGAEREVKVPLQDDDARLAAEAQLAAVRED
ncbi:MAG TPA: hypothetical protein VH107_00275, partial [Lacipirellulaceae bacterium]|nr:hypothetical protein [Lacipirellulaceae bacterium]